MQSKGLIRLFAILLALASIWQLSFTAVTRFQEKKAAKAAAVKAQQYVDANNVAADVREFVLDSVANIRNRAYIDSIGTEKVYLGYTYQSAKEKEINLGLDLKGGMNVMLQVQLEDLVKALSGNSTDPAFLQALALAKKNEALQHYCGTKMEYVEADVFQFLRKCRDEGRKFDLIVLDPPKFAATKGQLMKAARGYKDINLLAMKLLKPYGTLATFSCSGAMDAPFFDTVLAEAAEDAHRPFQIVAHTHAGADHPVRLSFPEGEYLKGVVLRSIT